ncbi:hypothetical protein CTI12_AA626790 [Artemisia annua]|uniref:Angiotensin-converting enzyme 2 n=1 Tax=Artemisia annua TaxID=35608 RepID=A0A2U1KA47_ARTAN|nr:hypothetical protein CTI12_AA626790 [Artemisia annua]
MRLPRTLLQISYSDFVGVCVFIAMSSVEERKVTPDEVERVKNMIEQCLWHYMNKKETIDILYQQKIEPAFTKIVWQTLEEQNQDFFKAYYPRLVLKEQIIRFNNLVGQQAAIMNQLKHRHEVVFPNRQSQIPPIHHMPHQVSAVQPPGGFDNVGQITHSMQHAYDMSAYTSYPVNMVMAQNPYDEMYQGTDNEMIPISNEFVSSFNSMDQYSHQLNGTLSDDFSHFLYANQDNLVDSFVTLVENQGPTTSDKMQIFINSWISYVKLRISLSTTGSYKLSTTYTHAHNSYKARNL